MVNQPPLRATNNGTETAEIVMVYAGWRASRFVLESLRSSTSAERE